MNVVDKLLFPYTTPLTRWQVVRLESHSVDESLSIESVACKMENLTAVLEKVLSGIETIHPDSAKST